MSLLSWIWDGIKAKVRYLVNSIVDPFKKWVYAKVDDLWEAIKNAGSTIIQYITKVYKTVEEYITNVYNYVTENIYNTINNITQNITNTINNITQNITNVTKNITQNITNINGATQDWVRNFAKLLVPIGFTSDPVGYVKAIINIWKDPWMNSVVKSFWEGFEEGLAE